MVWQYEIWKNTHKTISQSLPSNRILLYFVAMSIERECRHTSYQTKNSLLTKKRNEHNPNLYQSCADRHPLPVRPTHRTNPSPKHSQTPNNTKCIVRKGSWEPSPSPTHHTAPPRQGASTPAPPGIYAKVLKVWQQNGPTSSELRPFFQERQ